MIALSASNIQLSKCLRKFQARHVTHEYKPRYDSPAAIRGIVVHGLLEHSVTHGISDKPIEVDVNSSKRLASWKDFPTEFVRVKPMLDKIEAFRAAGWAVYPEYEAAILANGAACSWWDADCYARAKLDVLLMSPDRDILVIDWKTGRVESINSYQMPLISLILADTYETRCVGTIDYMIDIDLSIKETYLPPCGLSEVSITTPGMKSQFVDLIEAIDRLNEAVVLDNWPTTKHKCYWCEVPNCSEKRK